jgi:hypothetical protein
LFWASTLTYASDLRKITVGDVRHLAEGDEGTNCHDCKREKNGMKRRFEDMVLIF